MSVRTAPRTGTNAPVAPTAPCVAALRAGRRGRARRHHLVVATLAVLLLGACLVVLMVGNTFYGPDEVLRVVLGQRVPGASFTVGGLRLPRTCLAALAGLAFGAAGVTFQTLLRNALAAPDVIGISSGASAAGVIAIVVLSLDDTAVAVVALVGALVTAAVIHLVSSGGPGFAGTRLILVGIGVGAMLDSVVTYVLSRASEWDLQTAMRWLTGNVNGATWSRVVPLAVACLILLPLLASRGRALEVLRLGDDIAASLGVRVARTRILLLLAAVGLLAVATSAAGPIAFVAFMAGPIAARLVPAGRSLLVPSALVGGLLVVLADLVGQYAFGTRYPVGVVTGVLGAPYLVHLLIRSNRSGATL